MGEREEMKEATQRLEILISALPDAFSVRAYPKDVFRVSPCASFEDSKGCAQLYTQVLRGDAWVDFARGTESELRKEIIADTIKCPIPSCDGGDIWSDDDDDDDIRYVDCTHCKGWGYFYVGKEPTSPDIRVYHTVCIPEVPEELATVWHPKEPIGDLKVLTRGAFDSLTDAIAWARENLGGCPYSVKTFEHVGPCGNRTSSRVMLDFY